MGGTDDSVTQKVHLVSLGCPKNLVDSEVTLGGLVAEGFRPVDDPAEADVIVVNTCSFISAATEESIDTVLALAREKTEGRCRTLIVAGCMAQRYGTELERELPEVDYFVGTGEFHRIARMLKERPVRKVQVGPPRYLPDEQSPRVRSNSSFSAYLKVSEGCSQRCTFCVIPGLRGPLRSRRIASLVAEAEALARGGVVELNVVSQDTNAYGMDLEPREGRPPLARLLRELGGIERLRWIRLLYMYPRRFPATLMDVIAREPRVVKYLDLPLQHIDGGVLRRMGRGVGEDRSRRLVAQLRERIPGLVLRTTFMVGFPGETERAFQKLLDFVEESRFEYLGVFAFSPEEGTPAAQLSGQVPEEEKQARVRALMEVQQRISRTYHAGLVGTVQDVLVEGYAEETDLLLQGRLATQAPEVDGRVLINAGNAAAGSIVPVRIDQALDYDLVGHIVSSGGESWTTTMSV